MVFYFITVLDGIISGKHCGDFSADFRGTPYEGHERIKVPSDARITPGEPVIYYTDDWKRKSNSRLIEEGIMKVPEGCVWEKGKLRRMTPAERVINGLDEIPKGYKIIEGEIVPMTPAEKHETGLISDEEWKGIKLGEAEKELDRRLREFQTPEEQAMAELDEKYAVERTARFAALLAVRQQEGWPEKVEWPE